MIQIKINDKVIGKIEKCDIIESCIPLPDNTPGPYSGSISAPRVRFDRLQISEAFNIDIHPKTQTDPLYLEFEDKDGRVWGLKNCWVKSFEQFYDDDEDSIIIENVNISFEKIL